MKRIICLFKGHEWGGAYSIRRTFKFWDEHKCQRCGKIEGFEMGDWDNMCVQIDDGRIAEFPWPDPTPEMLKNPLFNDIWDVIKKWDIAVPGAYGGYCGATGNHARAIYDKLNRNGGLCDLAIAGKFFLDWYDADNEDCIVISRNEVGGLVGRHPK